MDIVNLKRFDPDFGSFVDAFFGSGNLISNVLFGDAKANIQEFDDKYIVDLCLAGYTKDDIKIDVEKNILTIQSEVKEESSDNTENYTRYEFKKKSFIRQFRIPEDADIDNLSAAHLNGILGITIPKVKTAQNSKRSVNIK